MKIFRRTKNGTRTCKSRTCKSRRAFSKFYKNTYDFPGGKKYLKNRSNSPGDPVQNFLSTHMNFPRKRNTIRTDTIFQENIPQEQIFCKIASSDAFGLQSNGAVFL